MIKSAEQLAEEIRNEKTWVLEQLAELCEMAGLSEEWEAADGDSFEAVAYKAAETLGVEI